MAAIETEALVKIYRSRRGDVRALDGVDLEVQEGTVLGLLGPVAILLGVFAPLAVARYRSIDR